MFCRLGISMFILGLAYEMPELETQITISLSRVESVISVGHLKSVDWSRRGFNGLGPACLPSPASCCTVVDLKLATDMTSSWVLLVHFSFLSISALNYFSFSKHKTRSLLACFAYHIGMSGCF